MLQRGFLKPRETEQNTRAVKRNRMFFFAGIFMILAGFLALVLHMQQGQGGNSPAGLILLIAGFLLMSVSMWLNFFTQNKGRRQ